MTPGLDGFDPSQYRLTLLPSTSTAATAAYATAKDITALLYGSVHVLVTNGREVGFYAPKTTPPLPRHPLLQPERPRP